MPPGSRFKKLCLSIVECDVSFKVVPASQTTVAFTIPKSTEGSNAGYYERYGEPTHGRQNIVSHEDALYHDVVLDAKDLVKRLQRDLFFRPGRSDLVKSVDPLVDGVPPSIEEKFEALVACIPSIPKVPHEVYVADEDIEYARGIWENRPILTSLSAPARRMG